MEKIISVVIFLCIGIFGFISSSYALPGNYLESCKNCQIVDGTLQCTCQSVNGNWNSTSLNKARVCNFIKNIDGQLTCTGSQQLNNLPAGSYQKTCQNCSFDGFRLSCQCQNRDQSRTFDTALNNVKSCRSGSIQNINGLLRCSRAAANVLPTGSYRKTCNNCNFDGNSLTCACLTRNQSWRSSTLQGADQCNGIKNVNG